MLKAPTFPHLSAPMGFFHFLTIPTLACIKKTKEDEREELSLGQRLGWAQGVNISSVHIPSTQLQSHGMGIMQAHWISGVRSVIDRQLQGIAIIVTQRAAMLILGHVGKTRDPSNGHPWLSDFLSSWEKLSWKCVAV